MTTLAAVAKLTIKKPVAAANSEAGHAILWAIFKAQVSGRVGRKHCALRAGGR